MYSVGMPPAVSVGGNVPMLIPGSQPLISVAAIASDVPTLMSQLVLAGVSLQNNLMAAALCTGQGILPSNLYTSSLGIPNTPAQSANSSVPQTSDHDQQPSSANQ